MKLLKELGKGGGMRERWQACPQEPGHKPVELLSQVKSSHAAARLLMSTRKLTSMRALKGTASNSRVSPSEAMCSDKDTSVAARTEGSSTFAGGRTRIDSPRIHLSAETDAGKSPAEALPRQLDDHTAPEAEGPAEVVPEADHAAATPEAKGPAPAAAEAEGAVEETLEAKGRVEAVVPEAKAHAATVQEATVRRLTPVEPFALD